jgi:RNA polymerase sigma-B factor
MPLNTSNKTRTQTLQLLKVYQGEPSARLQEQLVQLNIDLVHKVILNSVSQAQEQKKEQEEDKQLIEAGSSGLVQALKEFNLGSKQAFNVFALPYIHDHIQKHLENSSGKSAPAYPVAPSVDDKVRESDKQRQVSSTETNYRSFQQIPVDDSPSGPLKVESLLLLDQYRANPSAKLRNQLVQINMGLVRKEAYHWSNQCSESYEDLLQVGSMGLIRAIERFDMDKGHAFSSFAVPYIRGEIQHYLRDKSPTMRMPRRWLALYNQACKGVQQLRSKLNREPQDGEIADLLGIPVTEWQEIKLACQNRSPISLDTLVHENDDGSASLGDLVPDAKYRSFQLAQEDNIRLHQALSHLEDRTREIVEFVFLKEFTHREVAETLGISAVTVSRQVKKGLDALKKIMTTPLE